MSKKAIKSIFEGIISDVYKETCPNRCKKTISDKIKESKIKEIDKISS